VIVNLATQVLYAPSLGQEDAHWTPLLHWTDEDLASIGAALAQVCADWAREWVIRAEAGALGHCGVDVKATRVTAAPAARAIAALPLHTESVAGQRQAIRAWIGLPASSSAARVPSVVQMTGHVVFGDSFSAEPGSIAAELSAAALDSLVSAIRNTLGVESTDNAALDPATVEPGLPGSDFHVWSGGVRFALPWPGDLAIYLNGPSARKLLPPADTTPSVAKSGLTSLRDAAQGSTISLEARLTGVCLTLGQIKSLQVGDVVVLPHALDDPLCLVTESGNEICKAYLGRTSEWRSLEVVLGSAPTIGNGGVSG
jgi:hypothetical protein